MNRCHHCAVEFKHRPPAFTPDRSIVFCSKECRAERNELSVLESLPNAFIEEKVAEAHLEPCPKCQRPGPIDIHTTHRVYSFFVLTSFGERSEIACARCGRLNRLKDSAFCFLCGWWGFPLGFFGTPVLIARNLWNIGAPVRANRPSVEFRRWAVERLAVRLMHEEQTTDQQRVVPDQKSISEDS